MSISMRWTGSAPRIGEHGRTDQVLFGRWNFPPRNTGHAPSCYNPAHQPKLESMVPASFQIRDLSIRPAAVLAPMAGVTDTLFRRVIRGLGGCGLLMTEFTSSEGITRSAKKTLRYLYFQEDEHPITAQLFGANPAVMAEAANMVEDLGYDAVDINLGVIAEILDHLRGFGHDGWIRAEELRGDGMLVFLKIKIAQSFLGAARDAFGAGELRHQQAAAAKAANDAAKKRVRHTSHRRKHRGGADAQVANLETRRNH